MNWAVMIPLFVVGAAFLLYPLWVRTEEPLPVGIEGLVDEETQAKLEEKKRLLVNLRLLRSEFAEGKVTEEDFRRLEAEYEQQIASLIEAIERTKTQLSQATQVVPRKDLHRAGSLVLLVALALPTFWIMQAVQKAVEPEPGMMPAAGQQAPDVKAMVAKLEQRLRENPNDIKGQLMLARSYSVLGRKGEAMNLWNKALALEPGNKEARSGLVVALLQEGDQISTQSALKHIDILLKAEPNEGAWLWYHAQALASLGRKDEAKADLQKLSAMVEPGSENARMVQDALKELEQ